MQNQSSVRFFILLGFPYLSSWQQELVFGLLMVMYILTLVGNLLLIVTVSLGRLQDKPMYVLLRNLSFLEVCLTTVTLPRILYDLLSSIHIITYHQCALQMFFFFTFGESECFLLASMAYDRYTAICRPLHYPAMMARGVCNRLCLGSWLSGFIGSLWQTVFLFSLPYCGSHLVDHFFCEHNALIDLVSMDTFKLKWTFSVFAILYALFPFAGICISYGWIIVRIMGIKSSAGRQKCFSTCAAHLTSVTLYYAPGLCVYLRPRAGRSQVQDKYLSLMYCLLIPILNPIIYSLRNNDVKVSIKELFSKHTLI